MFKHVVTTTATGFDVKPSQDYLDKQAREQRMQYRKANPPTNPTNKQIYELMMDIADRQSEIYDMLKSRN